MKKEKVIQIEDYEDMARDFMAEVVKMLNSPKYKQLSFSGGSTYCGVGSYITLQDRDKDSFETIHQIQYIANPEYKQTGEYIKVNTNEVEEWNLKRTEQANNTIIIY